MRLYEIAGSKESSLIAATEFESQVRVYDVERRELVTELLTPFQYGGRLVAVIGSDRPLLLAGAYYSHGVAAYDVRQSRLLWQRKDMNRAQAITVCERTRRVGISRDGAGTSILCADSGETLLTLRGTEDLEFGPDPNLVLELGRKGAAVLNTSTGTANWRVPGPCFWGTWGDSGVVVNRHYEDSGEYGSFGPAFLEAFSPGGDPLWRFPARQGAHFLHMAFNSVANTWTCYEFGYATDESHLLTLTPEGELVARVVVPARVSCATTGGARYAVLSDGSVRDPLTSEVIWQFEDPRYARDYKRELP
jgi:hypothetical protein